MGDPDIQEVVVVVRYQGKIRWFRSDRDLWVLDVNKWRDEFINHGYDVPEFKDSYRFGIHCVDQETASRFLENMSAYELHKDDLSLELAKRYTSARSWWDVQDLFPIMFVDFDERKVGAFYPDGVPMERYIPDGWAGEFIDFANEYAEDIFPTEDKFWIKGDSDLLKLLNERGASSQ
ncbi:group-specific protein [Candidatus Thiodiazotropha endoloripes]|nr:group-specific protein [Candidatus Thiodiazotropha endoloripes]